LPFKKIKNKIFWVQFLVKCAGHACAHVFQGLDQCGYVQWKPFLGAGIVAWKVQLCILLDVYTGVYLNRTVQLTE